MNTKRSFRIRLIAPLVLLAAIAIAVLLFVNRPETPATNNAESARTVTAVKLLAGNFSPSLPIFVRASTPDHAKLSAAITADVIRVNKLPGDTVEQGELLLSLDDREAKLAVKQRRADILETQSQIDAEKLQHENELFVIRNNEGKHAARNREKIIKEHQIQLRGLQAKLLRAESALELAELDLQRTQIKAPFSGQITKVHVTSGNRVRMGDPLIELFNRDSLELVGTVPDRYIHTLRQALSSDNQIAAVGNDATSQIKAVLARISGEVSEGTGGTDVYFTITEGSESLPLNQSLYLIIQLPPIKNSFVIENTALYGTSTIYRINNERLQAIKIRRHGDYIKPDNGRYTLISSDNLHDGDTVMTTQLPNAIENLLVKISDQG